MSSLRKCIELAGKAVNTAEADALHAAAKQYRDDGYDVQTAERMAVTDAHERTVAQHKSIYEQLGIATKEAGWKGKETTPVAAEAEPAKSDAEQYQEIQAKMAALGHDKTGSPEYQQLWAQSEAIKNRNGGYVTEPAATEQAAPAATQGEQPNASAIESPTEVAQQSERPQGTRKQGRGRVEPSQQGAQAPREKAPQSPAVQQGEVGGKEALREALRKMDEGESGDTVHDLPNHIEAAFERGEVPPALKKAVDEYNAKRDADYEEFGARSGLEEEGANSLEAAVRKYVGKSKAESAPVAEKASTNEPAVDISEINNAKTEQEMHAAGGRLMRESNSRENMRAVQKAMQEWTPPAEQPRTAELRKNNADLGKKPVAMLSRAEKRAELDAAKITEYNGKKLDDINPAELSAAVGKMRQGELTPETKLTVDKITEKLDGLKIHKPGEVAAATPASLAWDAAIDLAKLGLRAGRPVEQIVRLAIDSYKAKHTAATDEDIARLRTAITDAAGRESGTIGSKIRKAVEKVIPPSGESALKESITAGRDAGDNAASNRAVEHRTAITEALSKIAPESTAQKAARFFNVPGRAKTAFDTADNALRFFIEADNGNVAKLQEMRDKISASTKADPKAKADALTAIDYALKNGDKLKEAASKVRGAMSDQLTAETAANLPVVERKNYVPRYQDVDERALFEPKGGGGGGVESHKVRTHETMADSIAAGVKPKSLSTVDSVTNRINAGMRAVGIRNFYDALGDSKTTKGDALMVKPEKTERANGTEYYEKPEGYELIDTPTGKMAVKSEYKSLVTALTDPSFFSKHPVGVAAMRGVATAKSGILALDTFHLGRMALISAAINSSGKGGGFLPSFKEGKFLYDHSPQEMAKMAADGQIPKEQLPQMIENKKILNGLVDQGYNTGKVADAIHQDFMHNLPILGGVNKFIFDSFTKGAMAEAGVLEFKRQKVANPSMSDAEVARKVSKELNTRFGNLGRQGIFKSATARDMARLIALAPQWNEGLIRSELGGAKQLAQGAANIAQGKAANVGALGRSLGTIAVGSFVAAQIINQATRGKFTWENPEEGWQHKVSAWIPDKLGGSAGFFYNPVGMTAETSHLLASSYERAQGKNPVSKGLQAAGDYYRSRESALARPIDTWLTKKDYLGRDIKPDDLPKEILKSAAPLPISGGSAARVVKGLATGGKTEQYPGEFQKQAMQSMGLRTDKAPTPENRIQSLAHDFMQARPGAKAESGTREVSDYAEMTASLRRNNPDDVKDSIKSLLEKRSADDLEKYYKQWMNHTFTGSHKTEADFLRTLDTEQRQQYVKARAERKKIGDAALRAIHQIPASDRAGPYSIPR